MRTAKKICVLLLSLPCCMAWAQRPHGHEDAIYRDSSIIVAWATGCTLHIGYQHIGDSSLGTVTVGTSASALGRAHENGYVSLGDGGSATLTFDSPVRNDTGYDFAVFENGFPVGGSDTLFFLELAFVEISSDGVNYFRFPGSSATDTMTQVGNGVGMSPRWTRNLAGNFTESYGTPFDLDEMKGRPGLDIQNITHIRIIDVVGSLNNAYATRDAAGRKINDPWPTPFASSGFDLDAVGVIHNVARTGTREVKAIDDLVVVYPVPANEDLMIGNGSGKPFRQAEIVDVTGRVRAVQPFDGTKLTIHVSQLEKGIYFVRLYGPDSFVIKKMIVE